MALCVMTPLLGSLNETYIHRHMDHLAPNDTVTIAVEELPEEVRVWTCKGPKLLLRRGGAETTPSDVNSLLKTVAAFWNNHNVNVVLAEHLQFAVEFAGLARSMNIKVFAHGHGFDCSAILRHDMWRKRYEDFKESDGLIVVSNHMKARLEELGIPASIIHRVPCGVDEHEIIVRKNHDSPVRLLAVGRLTGKKGPIFLLDSFRRALAENSNLELHWVGSGELGEAVNQFIEAFALGSKISLYGDQLPNSVQQFMTDADIFVQHSVTNSTNGDEEGLPVVILEAMARSLPVVSTFHAGISEAVEDGVSGLLVNERDTVGMAACINILALDHQMRLTMGAKGSERVRAEFTWSRERNALVEIMSLQ